MKLIDSHCHLDFDDFDEDREQIIKNCQQSGIQRIVIPATTRSRWQQIIQLAETFPAVDFALGLHPYFINQHRKSDLQDLEQYIVRYKPVAIGETGLDFYLKDLDQQTQLWFFNAQIDLAGQYHLPLIIHARKSLDKVLQLLTQKQFSAGGIMHAFNGSLQQAEKCIAMGFKLGFGGMLTYAHSRKLRSLARQLPLTSIVLETDAPDMSGEAHRGERNSPEYLSEVLASLSELRDEDIQVIAEQTSANSLEILKPERLDLQDNKLPVTNPPAG